MGKPLNTIGKYEFARVFRGIRGLALEVNDSRGTSTVELLPAQVEELIEALKNESRIRG